MFVKFCAIALLSFSLGLVVGLNIERNRSLSKKVDLDKEDK